MNNTLCQPNRIGKDAGRNMRSPIRLRIMIRATDKDRCRACKQGRVGADFLMPAPKTTIRQFFVYPFSTTSRISGDLPILS